MQGCFWKALQGNENKDTRSIVENWNTSALIHKWHTSPICSLLHTAIPLAGQLLLKAFRSRRTTIEEFFLCRTEPDRPQTSARIARHCISIFADMLTLLQAAKVIEWLRSQQFQENGNESLLLHSCSVETVCKVQSCWVRLYEESLIFVSYGTSRSLGRLRWSQAQKSGCFLPNETIRSHPKP